VAFPRQHVSCAVSAWQCRPGGPHPPSPGGLPCGSQTSPVPWLPTPHASPSIAVLGLAGCPHIGLRSATAAPHPHRQPSPPDRAHDRL
jgi:hypothetical protein